MILPYRSLRRAGDHPLEGASVIGEHARGHRKRPAIVEEAVGHIELAIEDVLFSVLVVHVIRDEVPYRRLRELVPRVVRSGLSEVLRPTHPDDDVGVSPQDFLPDRYYHYVHGTALEF